LKFSFTTVALSRRVRFSAPLTTALKNVMVAIPKNSTSYIFLVLAADRSKVRRVRVLAESCSADRNA
jgi:hypothetical protein